MPTSSYTKLAHKLWSAPAALAFALAPLPLTSFAQSGSAADDDVEQIVIIGSRFASRSSTETSVPVDVIDAAEIDDTGARETGRAIQAAAPSFNFSSSTISDGTDSLRPATLRGLGPDQTLVLVNGRRRHQGALIHINSSVGRGTAGVDLNAIPIGAIERVEVLRDGASAQYGSDAMAGVINLQLKTSGDGRVHFDYGQYAEGDGTTPHLWWHDGWAIGDEGFVTVTVDYRDREGTNRQGIDGSRNYPFLCSNGTDLLYDTSLASQVCGSATAYSDFSLANYTGSGIFRTDEASINRSSNYRIGDGDSEQLAVVVNLEAPISEDWKVLFFLTDSSREGQHGGFFRKPEQEDRSFIGANLPGTTIANPYADGFLPLINPDSTDTSISIGFDGKVTDDLSVSIASTVGENTYDYIISNSINASYFGVNEDGSTLTRTTQFMYVDASGATQTVTLDGPTRNVFEADAGGLGYEQSSFNVDFVWELSESLGVAFGYEAREETYSIRAGEDYSWANYGGHNPDALNNDGTGQQAYGGAIQVFPGFRPETALNESRDSIALYGEVGFFGDNYQADVALRYEDYSDFGDVFTLKASGRIGSEVIAGRGTISTGFRAPSLHQVYFNNVSTIFQTDSMGTLVPVQTGTYRNDSAIAQALGIPRLTEETSTNLSLGFVWTPEDTDFELTFDYYTIDISDRVLLSSSLGQSVLPADVFTQLQNAGVSSAQVFYNAGDTSTTGFDVVATYSFDLLDGTLDLSLGYNYNDTTVDSIAIPASLSGVGVNDLFSVRDRDIIENWQPESRFNFSVDYETESWTGYAALRQIGEYNISGTSSGNLVTQTVSASLLLDARFTFDVGGDVTISVGGDNILDEVPDTVDPSLAGTLSSRRGPLASVQNGVTTSTNIVDNNLGIFQFPRGAAPFGFNGAYYYVAVDYRYE